MRAPNNRASRLVAGASREFQPAAQYWGRQCLSLRPKSTSSLSHKLEDSITLTASQPRAVAVVRARGVGVGMRTSFQHAKLLEQSAPKLIVLGQAVYLLSFLLEFRSPLLPACSDLPPAIRAVSERARSSLRLQSNQMGSLTSQKKERQRWNCDN